MKDFLTSNKIYFETGVSVLLAIMAILVSINANSIAKAQLSLANDAQRIATLPYLPNIKARFKLVSSNDGVRKEKLEITNSGDSMYELRAFPIAFLALRELQVVSANGPYTKNAHLKKLSIPLESYFPNGTMVDDMDKDFVLYQDIENTGLLKDRLDAFSKKYDSEEKHVIGGIDKYLVVSYKDRFNVLHTDYFQFDHAGEGVLMGSSDGEGVFKRYNEYSKKEIKLDYKISTPEEIGNLWVKLKN
ncbi:hypothetical protein ACQJ22_25010 [Pseudomonas fragariae (ex Marin et al. 2024)]|uniref:Uncharacterized protein n=1 Tax=Pseudomonas avellanae TaxID=46257 RepID=A0A3M5U0Q7_9PSED|nr:MULTISPECIES: hypothetical protein [Pseudomonas syringae group]AKF43777.1 hypothetical protein PsyrB_01130 [Pseudomonas syringae pv. syringae B301D]EXL29599.1 hypothetical protein PssB301D_04186 [Pseudomonas syringae pv. syringae str. B301D-R]POP80616.1 hypothetical protein CXB38_16990 [Pseudomonas syringae]RMU39124.1 hypothetical protein ALP32_200283 [Pseudomonas avellanae]UQW67449.1 hypothetical protein L2Y00_19440 [Pseudomonas avellanae]